MTITWEHLQANQYNFIQEIHAAVMLSFTLQFILLLLLLWLFHFFFGPCPPFRVSLYSRIYDKKCVKKKERGRPLPGY